MDDVFITPSGEYRIAILGVFALTSCRKLAFKSNISCHILRTRRYFNWKQSINGGVSGLRIAHLVSVCVPFSAGIFNAQQYCCRCRCTCLFLALILPPILDEQDWHCHSRYDHLVYLFTQLACFLFYLTRESYPTGSSHLMLCHWEFLLFFSFYLWNVIATYSDLGLTDNLVIVYSAICMYVWPQT